MPLLYHYCEISSPDLANYKAGKFTYTYNGVASDKAFWVFDLKKPYRPGGGIKSDRLLLAFDFGEQSTSVISNPENFINFEDEEFKGETKHRTQVITKNNEDGAYGIGAMIRGFLICRSIRLADKKEMASAFQVSEIEVKSNQRWPK